MVAMTAEPGHSFASTRLFDSASGAQVTISFAIPVSDGLLTLEAAARVRESINNLIAAGFSVTAPGLEAGEEREAVGAISRREKNDGTPILDLFAPSEALVYKLITIYLDEPAQVEAFEKATGLTLKDIPLNDGDAAINRESKSAARLLVNVKRPAAAILKPNPKYDPNEQETAKKKPARLFVGWDVAQDARPAPSLELVKPNQTQIGQKSDNPNFSAPHTSTAVSGAPSTNAGWMSPATWAKEKEEWDAFLASALDKFQMDAAAVDAALKKLGLCDKQGIGNWHTQRGWALAALVAAFCKYDTDAISKYTAGLPAIDSVANLKLDRMAKQITDCPDKADDAFEREFGGDDPMGRKALTAELKNEMVVITSIEKDATKRAHDLWIARAPMADSSEPLVIKMFREDLRKVKSAGYTVDWPSAPGAVISNLAIAVTTYQNPTTGRRIESVLPPTMGLESETA